MTQIIPVKQVQINGADTNAVNSREIYEYLEVETRYNDWIQRAIEKYGFIKGEDYLLLKNEKNPNGGRPSVDYIVTIDMAKELCMVSNTLKGKETRRYFIEVEKQSSMTKDLIPRSFSEALRLAADLQDKNELLLSENNTMKPKAVFADSVAQSYTSILIGQFAKAISTDSLILGQNKLFKWLRDNGYLMESGNKHNQPYQRYIDNKYFETIERTINNPDGSTRITITTKITGKGQVALTPKIIQSFSLGYVA